MCGSESRVMLLGFKVRAGNPIPSLLASQGHQSCAGTELRDKMFVLVCLSSIPISFCVICMSRWDTKQQFNNVFLSLLVTFRHFSIWKELSVMASWPADQCPVRVPIHAVWGFCSWPVRIHIPANAHMLHWSAQVKVFHSADVSELDDQKASLS